jgi:hypothetical protein
LASNRAPPSSVTTNPAGKRSSNWPVRIERSRGFSPPAALDAIRHTR